MAYTTEQIKKMKDSEIVEQVATSRKAVRTAMFGAAGSRAQNVKELGAMKKDIARLLTELNSRKRATVTTKTDSVEQTVAVSAE